MWHIGGRSAQGRRLRAQFLAGYALGTFDRMTVTERVELRQERMFWKRVGMRLYGVTDRAVPKLLKPGLDYAPDFCEHCFRDLPGKRIVCPRCGRWIGESRPVAKAKAYLPASRMREYIEILLGDS